MDLNVRLSAYIIRSSVHRDCETAEDRRNKMYLYGGDNRDDDAIKIACMNRLTHAFTPVNVQHMQKCNNTYKLLSVYTILHNALATNGETHTQYPQSNTNGYFCCFNHPSARSRFSSTMNWIVMNVWKTTNQFSKANESTNTERGAEKLESGNS